MAEQNEPTLREARRIVNEHECRTHGHSLGHLLRSSGDPVRVFCERCHRSWDIAGIADRDDLRARVDAVKAVLDRPWPDDEDHHDFVNQQVEDARAALREVPRG